MEFFCFHRDRPGSMALRMELLEEHWAYMDRYSPTMIARGPTYDGEIITGSVHLLGLPDPAAARSFALDEPGYQAGVYRDVLLHRWTNLLGRTMWDAAAGNAADGRYLVLGLGPRDDAIARQVPSYDHKLIAFGPLLSDDASVQVGTAALVQAEDRETARAVLPSGQHEHIEVHRWRFGGRPT